MADLTEREAVLRWLRGEYDYWIGKANAPDAGRAAVYATTKASAYSFVPIPFGQVEQNPLGVGPTGRREGAE